MPEITEYIPKVDLDVSTIFGFLMWAVVFIVIVVIAIFGSWFIVKRFKYNKKIIIFERIGGKVEPTRTDRAIIRRFGGAGDMVLHLSKHKKYLLTPKIQTGRNVYWYFIREDGEWINFGVEDIDEKSRKLNVQFTDTDMRYGRMSLQRSLKERYEKPGFWAQYGGLVAYITLIALTAIMMWLLFDKFQAIGDSLNLAVKSAAELNEKSLSVVSSLDNICTGGSGMRPA